MKDRKQVLIGVAIVAVMAVVIALSQPEPVTAKSTHDKDSAHKQGVNPVPEPEVAKEIAEKKSIEPADSETKTTKEPEEKDELENSDSVLALIDMVENPFGRIRVLNSLLAANLVAEKPTQSILDVLEKQLGLLEADSEKLAAIEQIKKDLVEFEGNELLTVFRTQLTELEGSLSPVPHFASKITAAIEAPSVRVKVLTQIAVALSQAGDREQSTALIAKASELSTAIEEEAGHLAAQSALAVAQLHMGQFESAVKELGDVLSAIEALELSEDRLIAYERLGAELNDFAEHESVAAFVKTIDGRVLKYKYQADPVLRLVSGIEESGGRVRVLCNLAGTLALTGDQKQSAAMIIKAQEIIKGIETPEQLALALTHLAASQALTGQNEVAKVTLSKAMETVDGIESIDAKTIVLGELVTAVGSMDDADQIQTVLAQSLKTANAIQERAQAVMQQCLKLINRLPGGQQKAAAIEQIAQAMKQGNAGQFTELQFELATLHHEGRHLPKDAARAADWYRKAAIEGHTSAQLNLALMLLEGEGVKADPVEAHKWFLKAAEQGNAEGQVALGMMFALGQGAEVDLIQAYKWVSLSSKSGNEDAAIALKQLNTKLTAEQLVAADKLVKEWETQQIEPEPKPSEPAAKESEPTTTAGK